MGGSEKITSLSTEGRVFQPPSEGKEQAFVKSMEEYEAHYKRSMEDPEGYWGDRAEELLTWDKKWDKVLDADLHKPEINWFVNGKLYGKIQPGGKMFLTPSRGKHSLTCSDDSGRSTTINIEIL